MGKCNSSNTIYLVGRHIQSKKLNVLEVKNLPLSIINLFQMQSLQTHELDFYKENFINLLSIVIDNNIGYFAMLDPKKSNYYESSLKSAPEVNESVEYIDVVELVNTIDILDGSGYDYGLEESPSYVKQFKGCNVSRREAVLDDL